MDNRDNKENIEEQVTEELTYEEPEEELEYEEAIEYEEELEYEEAIEYEEELMYEEPVEEQMSEEPEVKQEPEIMQEKTETGNPAGKEVQSPSDNRPEPEGADGKEKNQKLSAIGVPVLVAVMVISL